MLLRLEDGEVKKFGDVVPLIAEDLRLCDEDRAKLLPSGRQAMFRNRLHWASFYLLRAGLIERPNRGVAPAGSARTRCIEIRISPAFSPIVKMALAEKVRLEIGVSNHFVQPTINAILEAARTGEVGDGKIMVLPIETIYRIRTGEQDQDAVTPVLAPASAVS